MPRPTLDLFSHICSSVQRQNSSWAPGVGWDARIAVEASRKFGGGSTGGRTWRRRAARRGPRTTAPRPPRGRRPRMRATECVIAMPARGICHESARSCAKLRNPTAMVRTPAIRNEYVSVRKPAFKRRRLHLDSSCKRH